MHKLMTHFAGNSRKILFNIFAPISERPTSRSAKPKQQQQPQWLHFSNQQVRIDFNMCYFWLGDVILFIDTQMILLVCIFSTLHLTL